MSDYIQIQDDELPAEVSYSVGSTAQTLFTFPYTFYGEEDLVVEVDGVTKTLNSDYTVSGAGATSGGLVTMTEAVTSGVVRIWRDTEIKRISGLNPAGPIKTRALNDEYSRQIIIDRDNEDKIGRAIKKPRFDSASMDIPDVPTRKNKLLGFGDAGQVTVTAPTTAAINYQFNDVISVAGKGDGVINDLEAFQTAIDDMIAAGLDTIYIPNPPGGEWYYVAGKLTNLDKVKTWIVEKAAFIDGPSNLLVAMTHYSGFFAVWDPPIEEAVIKVEDGFYTHQLRGGTGLYDPDAGETEADAEVVVGGQGNPVGTKESNDQQRAVYYESTDGALGLAWSAPRYFTTDSALATNPIPLDGETGSTRFTQWRVNPINFQQAGFGNRLWLTFAQGRASTIGGPGVYEIFAGQTKGTNYYLLQHLDDLLRFTRYGDARPAGSVYRSVRHEGRNGLVLTIHGARFGTDGRLYLMCVLIPRSGGGTQVDKRLVVAICDDPSQDIEDIVFYLSPSWPAGDMDYSNFWEWDNIEVRPGVWFANLRHNENRINVTTQEGGWYFGAWNNGQGAAGFHSLGIQASRSRATGEMLAPGIMALGFNDHPNARSNPALGTARIGGGVAAGLPMSDTVLTTERGTFRPSSGRDTLMAFVNPETDTIVGLTGVEARVTHIRSGGDRKQLDYEGFIADYPNSTIDLSADPELAPFNVYVAEVGGEEAELWVGGSNTSFNLPFDATNGSPGVTAFGGEGVVDLSALDFAVGTGPDDFTLLKSATDIDFLRVHQTGAMAAASVTTGQSVIDFSALGLNLVEGDTEIRRRYSADDEEALSEVFINPNTVGAYIEHLGDQSRNDRFQINAWKDELSHVPTIFLHLITGDLYQFRATRSSVGREQGGSGAKVAIIRKENLPNAIDHIFTPRQNAAAYFADTGNTYTVSGGVHTFQGRYSMGASLEPGRHRVTLWFRPVTVPLGTAPHPVLMIGSYDQFILFRISNDNGVLMRDTHLLSKAGGLRDGGVPMYFSREEAGYTIDGATMDPDAWMQVQLDYDTDAGEVTIEGQTVKVQPPYVLGLGDYFLISDLDTTAQMAFDIEGPRRMTIEPVIEEEKSFAPPLDEILGPNLVPDPGFFREVETDLPIQQPRATGMPGWTIKDRGGCNVILARGENSYTSANRNFGGLIHFLNVNVTGAIRTPESLATEAVEWNLVFPDARKLLAGNYYLDVYVEDDSDPSEPNTALSGGAPLQVFFFHDYGWDGRLGRENTGVDVQRINRNTRFYRVPLSIPQLDMTRNRVLAPDSYCGITFKLAAGYNAKLRMRYVALRNRDPWSPAQLQTPYDEDKTQRLYYEVCALNTSSPVAAGRVKDANTSEFPIELPNMHKAPSQINVDGKWAMEVSGVRHTATPTIATAKENLAVVEIQGSGLALTTGAAAFLIGVSPDTRDLSPNGSKSIFSLGEDRLIFSEADIDSIVHTSSAGSSTTFGTAGEGVGLRPSFDNLEDYFVGNGESSWNPQVSLPSTPSATDILKFNSTSGEEELVAGSGGFTFATGQPADGSADVTLLDTSGTAIDFVTGEEYRARVGERGTGADLIFDTVFPNSTDSTLKVHLVGGSSSKMGFDGREDHPHWQFDPATNVLSDAITNTPAANMAGRRFQKREIDKTIRLLRAEGIWDVLDLLYCFASHDEQSALLNWIDPTVGSPVATNSPIFTPYRGYTFDGSTNFIVINSFTLNSAPTHFAQNSASLGTFAYSHTTGPTAGSTIGNIRLNPDDGTDTEVSLNGSAQHATPYIRSDGVANGYQAVNRAAGTGFSYYGQGRNGNMRPISVTETSASVPSASLRFGRGGPDYGACELAWGFLGGSLSEAKHGRFAWIMEDHMKRIGAL